MSIRQLLVLILGVGIALGSAKLRWEARPLAWPKTIGMSDRLGYSRSAGSGDNIFSNRERAFADLGLVVMVAGAALVVGVLLQWCRPRNCLPSPAPCTSLASDSGSACGRS